MVGCGEQGAVEHLTVVSRHGRTVPSAAHWLRKPGFALHCRREWRLLQVKLVLLAVFAS